MPVALGIPPKASSPRVSKSMKGNKANGTKPEISLRKALRSRRLAGYRLNFRKIPGSPDICYPSKKVAIFVNGCFWHRCPHCKLTLPRSNKVFWRNKFNRNKERDRLKTKRLRNAGWKVLTVWECQIYSNADKVTTKISKYIKLS